MSTYQVDPDVIELFKTEAYRFLNPLLDQDEGAKALIKFLKKNTVKFALPIFHNRAQEQLEHQLRQAVHATAAHVESAHCIAPLLSDPKWFGQYRRIFGEDRVMLELRYSYRYNLIQSPLVQMMLEDLVDPESPEWSTDPVYLALDDSIIMLQHGAEPITPKTIAPKPSVAAISKELDKPETLAGSTFEAPKQTKVPPKQLDDLGDSTINLVDRITSNGVPLCQILGNTGSGKTTLIYHICKVARDNGVNLFLIDKNTNQWDEFDACTDPKMLVIDNAETVQDTKRLGDLAAMVKSRNDCDGIGLIIASITPVEANTRGIPAIYLNRNYDRSVYDAAARMGFAPAISPPNDDAIGFRGEWLGSVDSIKKVEYTWK